MDSNTIAYMYAQRLFETKGVLDSLIKTLHENGSEPCNKESDFSFSINVEYQNYLGLDEDNFGRERELEVECLKRLMAEKEYAIYAVSDEATETIDSAVSEDEAKSKVAEYSKKLLKGEFSNHSLVEVTHFGYDQQG